MSKSELLPQQGGRCGVSGEVCFNFPLDPGDFFIDVISWIALLRNAASDPRNHTNLHEGSYFFFAGLADNVGLGLALII